MPPWILGPDNHVDLVGGRFAATTADHLVAAVDAIAAVPKEHPLVLHFHGGLVSRAAARTTAESLAPVYVGAGGVPFFVVWNSDLVSTVKGSLAQIGQEPIFLRLVKKIAQWVASELQESGGARGATLTEIDPNAVPDDAEALDAFLEGLADAAPRDKRVIPTGMAEAQIEKNLRNDQQLRQAAQGALASPISSTRLDAIAAESPDLGTRSLAAATFFVKVGLRVIGRVIGRFAARRDHGVYTTIVEEVLRELYVDRIGGLVWRTMRTDTADAFGPDPALHGGTALAATLASRWTPGRRLVLVGHSTGAIYIANLLAHLETLGSPLPRADVVFLAPAISFASYHGHREAFAARTNGVRMLGLSDAVERAYWEVPLYRGSLLYMVSGLFEDEPDTPILGMQRYFDAQSYGDSILQEVGASLPALERVWSTVDGGPGRSASALRHGDMDEDPMCRASLAHVVATGLGGAG